MRRELMSARVAAILIALVSACTLDARGQSTAYEDVYRLSLPHKTWALDVRLSGFSRPEELKRDREKYVFFARPKLDRKDESGLISLIISRLYLIIRMEPTPLKVGATDAPQVRAIDQLAKEKRISKSRIKASEHKQILVLRYSIADDNPDYLSFSVLNGARGAPTKGLVAYLVKEGTWIRIGLEAQPLKQDDEQLFYSVLDSVRITDISNPTSSFDFYELGRSQYSQKEYANAVESLRKAVELEQQKRQLSMSQWRHLVEYLTDAYGATGNLTQAKETLRYGLNNDPTWPYFHLGLARLSAYINDLDNTIASLQKAYLYENNRDEAQGLPNPMYDPAFKRFHKNDQFRKAVKSMRK